MKKIIPLVVIGIVTLAIQPALGCTIPVFRYALEKWDLTPYDILVYHHGALPADLQKSLKPWTSGPSKANIDITIIDLDGKVDAKHAKLWKAHGKDAKGPWMLVRSRSDNATDAPAWSGPCTAANLNAIVDSPMRQAILAHLTRGASAVYVLLTSDDEKADKAAYDMAVAELRALEAKIKLPEQPKDGPQLQLPLPLKVSLPLLVLDRKRPDEAAFIRMLMATEEDLDKKKGPILFPIFGRGRVLAALGEKDLTKEVVAAATSFLCKECSCQVKELNPGVDLLMIGNWESHIRAMFDKKTPVAMPKVMPTMLPSRASASAPKK